MAMRDDEQPQRDTHLLAEGGLQSNLAAIAKLARAFDVLTICLDRRFEEERKHADQRFSRYEDLLNQQAESLLQQSRQHVEAVQQLSQVQRERAQQVERKQQQQPQQPQQQPQQQPPDATAQALLGALAPLEVVLGRIEAKLAPVQRIEAKLAPVEAALVREEATLSRPPPGPPWSGAVAGPEAEAPAEAPAAPGAPAGAALRARQSAASAADDCGSAFTRLAALVPAGSELAHGARPPTEGAAAASPAPPEPPGGDSVEVARSPGTLFPSALSEAGEASSNAKAEGQLAWLWCLLEEAEMPQHFARAAEWVSETGCEACDARNGAATEGLIGHLGLQSFPASRLRKAAKVLQEEATAQKPARPQPVAPAPALPAPAPARGPPTCLSAFLSVFTMGFSTHTLVVASVQGNKEMASRLHDQFTNIGILSAFIAAIVGEFFLFGMPEESPDDVYAFFGLFPIAGALSFGVSLVFMVASFALLILSSILSMTSLVVLDVVVDDAVGKFFQRVGWSLRAPYLCLIFGVLCCLVGAFISAPLFFATTGVIFQGTVLAALLAGLITMVRLIYVADGEAVEFSMASGQ